MSSKKCENRVVRDTGQDRIVYALVAYMVASITLLLVVLLSIPYLKGPAHSRLRPLTVDRPSSPPIAESVEQGRDGPQDILQLLPDTEFDKSAEVTGCPFPGNVRAKCMDAADGKLYAQGLSGSTGPYSALMQDVVTGRESSNHGSNLLEIPNGTLLLTWFSGPFEGESGVAIVLSRLDPGSQRWTRPVEISVEVGRSAQNPVLFYDNKNSALMLLHTSQLAKKGQATAEVRQLKSLDMGATWQPHTVPFHDPGAFVRNSLLHSQDGESVLLPMYYTPDGFAKFRTHYSTLRRTSDGGATWTETHMTQKGEWLAQPSVVRLANDTLVAFFRDRRGEYIYRSTSEDDGLTWSPARRTRLPSNNSGLQAVLLASGWIALVFNNVAGGSAGPRFPLSLALSQDAGVSWPYVRDIEIADGTDVLHLGRRQEWSYPSIVQNRQGLLQISYTFRRDTIKHVVVTQEWVEGGTTVGNYKPREV
ncbi:hypothetical protein CYMTET_49610 [Cymbomonas tetramitiformis]|uniref:Sialidase domain-containing protein n=1 Tax=Cymbomonas tetramitiformis TaxID=36881 RepID=A0AAE0BPY1_9CHLO|nr:hypothetical protein CYMTET_49610 [Cymbomonas tetramitiformis]|eukprot:gene23278-28173_t